MMRAQSLPFLVGYLFSKMDESIFNRIIRTGEDEFTDSKLVPKIWFGLKASSSVLVDIPGEQKYYIGQMLQTRLKDMYPNYDTIVTKVVPDAQYIRFDYKVSKIPKVQEMTIAEIEKRLGHKIKIVGESLD